MINDKTWVIVYKWNLRYEGQKLDGLCCHETKTIFIDRSLNKADKDLTFIHELIHAIINEQNIKRSKLSRDVEEKIVVALSEYLISLKIRLKF